MAPSQGHTVLHPGQTGPLQVGVAHLCRAQGAILVVRDGMLYGEIIQSNGGDKMKLCKECKHVRIRRGEYGYWYDCRHPASKGPPNIYSGKSGWNDCYRMREGSDICGKEGKLWELKHGFYDNIRNKIKELWGKFRDKMLTGFDCK